MCKENRDYSPLTSIIFIKIAYDLILKMINNLHGIYHYKLYYLYVVDIFFINQEIIHF